jgi:hypothetical protein
LASQVLTAPEAFTAVAIPVAVAIIFSSTPGLRNWRQLRRAEFIRTYRWPPGLLKRLEQHHPGLTRKDSALVSRGQRQFFIAYLMSGRRYVSMPSQIVDDLWHEFILYTRDYDSFCRRAFGGLLHHTPAAALTPQRGNSNEGLRRVWWYSCKYENINPAVPSRLPLLFALDAKLHVPNGFFYQPDCDGLRSKGLWSGGHCGGDFSNDTIDGSLDGYGEIVWRGGHGGESGCGGGDGGGHGGGHGCGGGGHGGCGGGSCGGGGH